MPWTQWSLIFGSAILSPSSKYPWNDYNFIRTSRFRVRYITGLTRWSCECVCLGIFAVWGRSKGEPNRKRDSCQAQDSTASKVSPTNYCLYFLNYLLFTSIQRLPGEILSLHFTVMSIDSTFFCNKPKYH